MLLYSDTELDNDIKYVKEVLSNCKGTYKDIGENFTQLNKTVTNRVYFISTQFKNMFGSNKLWN